MVRFILKINKRSTISGVSTSSFETLPLEVPELEAALQKGYSHQWGYEVTELVGAAIEQGQPYSTKENDEKINSADVQGFPSFGDYQKWFLMSPVYPTLTRVYGWFLDNVKRNNK